MLSRYHKQPASSLIGQRVDEDAGREDAATGIVLEGQPDDPRRRAQLQDEQVAAATSSIPTTSSAITAPTRSGCTRCTWARWRRRSPGTRATSSA